MKRIGEPGGHFGPAVYTDGRLRAPYNNVDFDVERMGEILERDFSEVSQEEWDRARVVLTDKLSARYGGYATTLLNVRYSRAVRFASAGFSGLERMVLGHPRTSSFRQHEVWSGGADVLIVLNLASKFTSPIKGYFQTDELSQDVILAHELKHGVDHLIANRTYKDQMPETDQHAKKLLEYLAGMATGSALAGAGLPTYIAGLIEQSKAVTCIGAGSYAAGISLTLPLIYKAVKEKALSAETFGVKQPEYIYGYGEDPANAYALATKSDWEGVVKV